jgi:hypothetical protein
VQRAECRMQPRAGANARVQNEGKKIERKARQGKGGNVRDGREGGRERRDECARGGGERVPFPVFSRNQQPRGCRERGARGGERRVALRAPQRRGQGREFSAVNAPSKAKWHGANAQEGRGAASPGILSAAAGFGQRAGYAEEADYFGAKRRRNGKVVRRSAGLAAAMHVCE